MSYVRIAIALGIPESSNEDAILQRIEAVRMSAARDQALASKLCELTGKATGTEALGVAYAWAGSARGGAAPKSYAQMSGMERHQLKRADPERFRQLRQAALASGSELHTNAPPPPAPEGGPKTYAQMSSIERHQLKRADPERFRQLRQAALASGDI